MSLIESKIKLEQLVNHLGFKPNHAGFISCPGHSDRTPSLKLYFTDNRFKCYQCGEGGGVIRFYMLYKRCSMKDAIKALMTIFKLSRSVLILRPRKIDSVIPKEILDSWERTLTSRVWRVLDNLPPWFFENLYNDWLDHLCEIIDTYWQLAEERQDIKYLEQCSQHVVDYIINKLRFLLEIRYGEERISSISSRNN